MARRLWPLHGRLVPYVLVAAATGLLLPAAAARLAAGVPYMLAGQVLGVALTLTVRQFAVVRRRPLPVVLALAVQWTALPLVGVGLYHLPADADVRAGVLILAVVPAESPASIAVLAGGYAALVSLHGRFTGHRHGAHAVCGLTQCSTLRSSPPACA